MGNQNGIKNLRTGTPHSYAHAFGSPVRACVEANPPSLPYLGAMSNENELTTFLDQEEHNEFKQVIEYLDTQKRGLPYNDPERIRMNFLQDFLELMARTGVKFHDDTNAPYLQGTKEGLAEVTAFMKKNMRKGYQGVEWH